MISLPCRRNECEKVVTDHASNFKERGKYCSVECKLLDSKNVWPNGHKKHARPDIDETRFRNIVENSLTIQEVCNELNVARHVVKKMIGELEVSVKHMTNAKGRVQAQEVMLSLGDTKRNEAVKKYIFAHKLLAEECSICGQGKIWMGNPLTLELDHIDGNPLDNRIENLRILCPNCHTQAPTSKGKRRK